MSGLLISPDNLVPGMWLRYIGSGSRPGTNQGKCSLYTSLCYQVQADLTVIGMRGCYDLTKPAHHYSRGEPHSLVEYTYISDFVRCQETPALAYQAPLPRRHAKNL